MAEGPIDLMVLTFSGDTLRGAIASGLRDLVDNGTVRIVDFLFVRKDKHGMVETLELADLDNVVRRDWKPLVSSVEDLLSDNDAKQVASLLDENSAAVMLVLEDWWAANFRAKMQSANVDLLIMQRIPRALVGTTLKAIPTTAEVQWPRR